MSEQTWKTVKLPSQIIEDIKKVIPWLGFPSVAEYVRHTVRERELRAARRDCSVLTTALIDGPGSPRKIAA